jgi:hypothetical protein
VVRIEYVMRAILHTHGSPIQSKKKAINIKKIHLEPMLTGALYFKNSTMIFSSFRFFEKKYLHRGNDVYFNCAIS